MEVCPSPRLADQGGFGSTHWTTIRACVGSDQATRAAREALCRDYWYPLYAHIKRQGYQDHDAEDLTQEFFAHVLDRPWFFQVDQTKGKFRSFLLVSLHHFLRDRFHHRNAQKRGGGIPHVPLDTAASNAPPGAPVVVVCSRPADPYELEWVSAVLTTALRRLEAEHARADKLSWFQRAKAYLSAQGDAGAYADVAKALGMTADGVSVGIHRLRRRYGVLLREEVARTVAGPGDIEDEMRYMREVLAT